LGGISFPNIPTSFSLSVIKNDFNDNKPVQIAGTIHAPIYHPDTFNTSGIASLVGRYTLYVKKGVGT
jgi:hypothetical protein